VPRAAEALAATAATAGGGDGGRAQWEWPCLKRRQCEKMRKISSTFLSLFLLHQSAGKNLGEGGKDKWSDRKTQQNIGQTGFVKGTNTGKQGELQFLTYRSYLLSLFSNNNYAFFMEYLFNCIQLKSILSRHKNLWSILSSIFLTYLTKEEKNVVSVF